ncbi:MAG TPA: cytidylate kinase family protein [Candidatus Sulfotelmatobacter sp.]|nr:cytidylate kinase family protein [Candidatus Sulfotelmatobacter sp.]
MIVSSNTGSNPNNRSVVICISGLAGTGKSTVARKLAKEFCLKYYSGGDALKALASDEGYDTSKPGWWESPVGLEFLMQRQGDSKFDEAIDRRLLEYAKQGNVLLDSWTMPWLVKDGFKVWLLASLEKRAERVAKRDGLSVQEALEVLKEKEERTRAIYEKLYGFSLGEDFKPFDMILDTEKLDEAEVYQILCQVITKMVLEKQNFCHQ